MSSRIALALLLASSACGGSPPPTTAVEDEPTTGSESDAQPATVPPSPQARVRLIHAAIEARDSAVALVADGATLGSPAGYEFAAPYLSLPPGDHTISARSGETELIQASFHFDEGSYSLIAYSTGDFPVALVHVADTAASAPAHTAQIRVFHALVGQGAIDICHPPESGRGDGTAILGRIEAGTMASNGYVSVPGGETLVLQIRSESPAPCHGRVLGTTQFTPASESNYTLALVGRSGRHRVDPELLFCADPPASDTSCATAVVEAH